MAKDWLKYKTPSYSFIFNQNLIPQFQIIKLINLLIEKYFKYLKINTKKQHSQFDNNKHPMERTAIEKIKWKKKKTETKPETYSKKSQFKLPFL